MGYRDYNTGISGTCRDCEERYPACHDTCEKYIEAKGQWLDKKNKIREARNEARLFDDYKAKKIARERRSKVSAGRRV